MPAPYVNNTLTASISTTDIITNDVVIDRSVGNPSWPSMVGLYTQVFVLSAGDNVLGTPGGNVVRQIYIKNTDPSNYFAVKWEVTGEVTGPVFIGRLFPGDVTIQWQNPNNANSGMINITVTPIVAGTLCEYFLGF